MENDQDIMVIAGYKEDVSIGLKSVCKDVEILSTERNVWRSGPRLIQARSALACVHINNENLQFKWMYRFKISINHE